MNRIHAGESCLRVAVTVIMAKLTLAAPKCKPKNFGLHRKFKCAFEPVCSTDIPVCGFWRLFRLRGAPKRRFGATAASHQSVPFRRKRGTRMSREPAD